MKTEKVLSILLIISLLFVSINWPGAKLFVIMSLLILALVYFPFAFYFFSDKTLKRQNLAVSIIFGWLLSIIPIGIMFKLMFWPGYHVMILTSCLTAPILLIIAFILFKKSKEDLKTYYKNLLSRTTVLTIAAFIMLAMPLETLIKFQSDGDTELDRLKVLYYTNPENSTYKKQHDDYLTKRDSIYESE